MAQPLLDLRTPLPCDCGSRPPRLRPHGDRPQISGPADADAVVAPLLRGLDRERCLVLSLDARHRLIAVDTASIGTATHTFMAPREIYRDALLRGASALFLAHNHPSGDPSPSDADVSVTRRLARAGATVGIELLDHLIVGDTDFTSLAREGVV